MLDRASPGGGLAASVYCQDQELELIENEFRWGPKARMTQENNLVYYESFFFEGTEYSCFDSIYLYKEGEPEPYIGKILEVWEDQLENRNKMKVLWFFRPIEIPKWLEDESKPAHKEIFLASGKGKGVTNVINTLNVIVGKCKVLCTSVDNRNPQPSEEDLEATHYYFYRRFDVENYTISEDMDLIIKDFGVESIFNIQSLQKTNSAAGLSEEHQTNEGERIHHTDTQSNRAPILDAHQDIAMGDVLKEGFHEKADAVMLLNNEDIIYDGDGIRANTGVDDMVIKRKETPKMDCVNEEKKVYKRLKSTPDIVGSYDMVNGFSAGAPLVTKDTVESESLDSETVPLSKVNFIDGSPRVSEGQKFEELNTRLTTIEVSHTCQMIKENPQIEEEKSNENDSPKGESIEVMKSTKTPQLIVNLSQDSVKKVDDLVKKVEDSVKKLDKLKKKGTNSKKLPDKKPSPTENSLKASKKSTNLVLQPDGAKNDKEPFKVTQNKRDGRGLIKRKIDSTNETSNLMSIKSKLGDDSPKAFEDLIFVSIEETGMKKENISAHKIIEVTKRSELESNKCFKGHPWDEHLQRGYEQGSVVLIENIDPSYTSTEVEDIIWNVFAEHCTAKVIPQTAVSIPGVGQALLVFKTKQGAEVILKKLEEGCLMLSNERPLIATKANLVHSTKSIKFAGHLSVEKHNLQMQPICQTEDMIKAVPSPHCSQPHTIEYAMAMEWALMQEKSDRWWTELYKKQEEEIKLAKRKLCILNPEMYPGS
ncbi:protein ANTI-SILENCING 1 isoform X2 [Cryptomeria japonica]|uniref:protein ANTI-SILENCING 1 isoform X2 n=1 Tax=Cryptomeria japonica TaxID=3369 RepID=UPI0027DAA945|nr:protein ANTI-SILENCING 1 isoform X2 [Cryptomeria japonica]